MPIMAQIEQSVNKFKYKHYIKNKHAVSGVLKSIRSHIFFIAALRCGRNKAAEKRMGSVWSAFEFRVELAGNEPRMRRDLHHLNDMIIRRSTGKQNAVFSELLAVIIIYLIAVTVALIDHGRAVKLIRL